MEIIPKDLPTLRRWWELHKTDWSDAKPEDFCQLAEASLALHDPFLGLEILEQAHSCWPEDAALLREQIDFLAACGASRRAFELLDDLFRRGQQDFQTLLLLGNLTRESVGWVETDRQCAQKLINGCILCERLIRASKNDTELVSSLICAGETSVVCALHDQGAEANKLAQLVVHQCKSKFVRESMDVWLRFQMFGAEALSYLAVKQFDDAKAAFQKLGELAQVESVFNRLHNFGKTRQTCQRLLQRFGLETDLLDAIQMPKVAVFTGHMVDVAGREIPRFPLKKEGVVAARLAAEIDRLNPAFGYASCACGGDIIFNELMLQRGKQIHLVLPCPVPEFREACLDRFPGNWNERFDRIHQAAASVLILSEQCANDNAMASECCNRVVLGSARIKAAMLGSDVTTLALWDGRKGDAIGGTYSMVEFSLAAGVETRIIDILKPESETRDASQMRVSLARSSAVVLSGPDFDPPQQICALLFADVVHYSKLKERQIPRFVDYYLQGVSELFKSAGKSVLAKNTWGDGLYAAFDSVKAAGVFALELRDFAQSRDWQIAELVAGMDVRIALHAGPVYKVHDPVINQTMYMGAQTSKAGRIEPCTPPGQVYSSQVFAALAAAEGVKEFTCEYVGVLEWAKGYGSFPTYVVESQSINPQ